MKLKNKAFRKALYGLPSSYREWWDIGDGFEIYVDIGEKACSFAVLTPTKSYNYEVAQLLNLDTSVEKLVSSHVIDDKELFVSMGIDCVVINYTKPKEYKAMLHKIEEIVNTHLKKK